MSWLQRGKPDQRNTIVKTRLESAITEAVRRECPEFVGVLVERVNPPSRDAANWEIRGVKYGKADRQKASVTLAAVRERMQSEFKLAEEEARKGATGPTLATIPLERS